MKFEQPKIEEPEEEKPKHKVELEERPMPRKKEVYVQWIKRIGGPNVEVVSNLEKYSLPRKKIDRPMIIDFDGGIILNDQNISENCGKKNKEQIDKWIEQKTPHIIKEKEIYELEKELFNSKPDIYFQFIGDALRGGHKIVADEKFGDNMNKWMEELKEKKLKEKPKKKEKPEAKEKTPTLDEKIEQKQKEIKEIELGYNIYYSPVVQDLLGLYYKEKYKGLKGLKKELKELKKEPEGLPEEIPKKLTTKDYLKHIRKTDKLFTEMTRVRGAVKRGEINPSEYDIKKNEWRAAYQKTLEMNDELDEKDMEKIMKMGTKKKGKDLLKKKWKSFWGLLEKRVGKGTIEKVVHDAIEEEIEIIKKRLEKLPQKIKESSVLDRANLEKEQKRLEKLLEKYKKKRQKQK